MSGERPKGGAVGKDPKNGPAATPKLPGGLILRAPRATDAAALLALGRALLDETDHFVRLPRERAQGRQDMAAIVDHYTGQPGWAMLHVWDGPRAVAEGVLSAGQLSRTAHVGTLGIGVLRAYWGRGIGRTLMARLEDLAAAAALERLEFTVLSHNARARDFYARLGYGEEGVRCGSVRYGGEDGGPVRYGDEVMMAKWIGPTRG